MTTTTEVTATPPGRRALAAALGNATSDLTGIVTLLLTVATVPGAFVGLRDAVHLPSPWPEIGCVVPIALFLVFYLLPEWRLARDRKALEDFGVMGEPHPPGYFRLTAYSADDRAKFRRPDGGEVEVLRWIQRSHEPLIYLVGLSGVGKSSLLGSHVIPELKEGKPGWIVVEARPYDNPLLALAAALQRPGIIWKNPAPEQTDTRAILERAANTADRANKRLLIVLDQFEEALILLDG
jgi:hypothetical protein